MGKIISAAIHFEGILQNDNDLISGGFLLLIKTFSVI